MNKALIATIVALFAVAIFTSFKDTYYPQQISQPALVSFKADECPESLAVECAVDIERTVKACSAAFSTGGTDIIADIKCTKDLMSDKKHCWPCICSEAHKQSWKIVGC